MGIPTSRREASVRYAVRRLGKLPKCAVKAIALCAVAAGAQVLLRWSGRIDNIDAVYLACRCTL
jgi:hypothetical protein